MMRMLEDGGMPIVTDAQRQADIDNPKGYFEFEQVKGLDKGDDTWLEGAKGKGVKVISWLLVYLPPRYDYRVIFMHRNLEEVLASQAKMLAHRGRQGGAINDTEMTRIFTYHLHEVKAWLAQQANIAVLDVDYGALVADPHPQAERVKEFLGGALDLDRMTSAVDPSLHRNRAG